MAMSNAIDESSFWQTAVEFFFLDQYEKFCPTANCWRDLLHPDLTPQYFMSVRHRPVGVFCR